jgi:hypothetical protein
MYYSGRINTYKLDRTTVTVGAPKILAMSTSPASAGASSCASVAAASSVVAAAGCVLPSATGGCRSNCANSSSTVGAGLRLPPAGSPTVSQSPSSPCSTGRKAASPASKETSSSTHNIETSVLDYSVQDGIPLGTWSL